MVFLDPPIIAGGGRAGKKQPSRLLNNKS
ncbi:hypothetical protein P4T89_19190, partial [Bacillus nakamurai]|nr:hypothetical protein [Bacillus nakamurai]